MRIAQDLLTQLASTPTTPASFEDPVTHRSVVVSRIVATDRHKAGPLVLLLDAKLENLPVAWSDVRLVGRPSRLRKRLFLVILRAGRSDITTSKNVIALYLPYDVRTGDLLALPNRTSDWIMDGVSLI